jgi:hypothetical protein
MSSIYLKGDKLKYWIEHSDLIQILAELDGVDKNDGTLELTRDLFPNFDEGDWDFLRKFLNKKDISFTKSEKYGTFVYNIKGYTESKANNVLDFIMYGKKMGNIDKLLLSRRIKAKTSGRRTYNYNNNNNNNNNNYNNNNNGYKKNKYYTGIPINNNNNSRRKPYAKSKSKSMKKKK